MIIIDSHFILMAHPLNRKTIREKTKIEFFFFHYLFLNNGRLETTLFFLLKRVMLFWVSSFCGCREKKKSNLYLCVYPIIIKHVRLCIYVKVVLIYNLRAIDPKWIHSGGMNLLYRPTNKSSLLLLFFVVCCLFFIVEIERGETNTKGNSCSFFSSSLLVLSKKRKGITNMK